MQIPRILLAAASSGSGKTIAACGLMAALKKQGETVVSCKCGPDYIDPMFHREVLGVDSENLDLFFCDEERLHELFVEHTKAADITVVEGVMGYYDGMRLDRTDASSYEVAKVLQIPVVLVVPAKGVAVSILALIKGMIEFRRDSNIQGILLNQVSEMLYPKMKEMIENGLRDMGYEIPVVGYLPKSDVFHLESRHLGLVTPKETKDLQEKIKRAGAIIEQTVDLEQMKAIARQAPELEILPDKKANKAATLKVAIARDEAFCFYYKANLTLLEELGCELIPFSPLRDMHLPEGIQGLLLGGGYPELHAAELAANQSMRYEIKKQIKSGLPCLAECGGFMYLHDEMEGADGEIHFMAGAIKGRSFRTDKLGRFGYISITKETETPYLKKEEQIRGHEFHYWDSTDNGSDCIASKPDGKRSWKCIHAKGNLFAGYPHLYFYSNPEFAKRFVRCCAERSQDDTGRA